VTGVVGDAAGALRRRREGRRPYAKLYAEDGRLTMLAPDSDRAQAMIEVAEAMVDVAVPVRSEPDADDA
jgi:putative heme iron utilization protein